MKKIIFIHFLVLSFLANAQMNVKQKPDKSPSNNCYKFAIYPFKDTLNNAYTLYTGNSGVNKMLLNLSEENIINSKCYDDLNKRIKYLDKYLKTADSLKQAFKKVSILYVHIDSISQPDLYREIIIKSNTTYHWNPVEKREEKNNSNLPFQNMNYGKLREFFIKSNYFIPLKNLFEKYLRRKVVFDFIILDESTFTSAEKLTELNKSLKLTKSLYPKNISFYMLVK